MPRVARTVALACGLIAFAPPVRADTHGEAEQLFREAKDLQKAGRHAEACASFEASQRLDPNIATLMNLADCREKNHELATAWSLFLQVASKARGDASYSGMGEFAVERAAALERRLSHLIINVPDESRVDGLVVQRNGANVDPATWNRAIAVDGGRYVITAKAPDHEPWSTDVTVGDEADTRSVDVPRFKRVLHARVAPAPERGASAPSTASRRRLLQFATAGVAVGALAGAVGLELSGRHTYADYEASVPGTPASDELYDRANRKHHLAQGLAAVGVASAALTVYVWVLAPRSASDRRASFAPAAHPGFTGVVVRGGF